MGLVHSVRDKRCWESPAKSTLENLSSQSAPEPSRNGRCVIVVFHRFRRFRAPGSARSSQEQPGAARSSQRQPGTTSNAQTTPAPRPNHAQPTHTSHFSLLTCHLPPATCHLPLATCHLPLATCHLSLVTCHLPRVTCHLLLVTCHLPLLTSHFSLLTSHAQTTPKPRSNHATMSKPGLSVAWAWLERECGVGVAWAW